jgi:hypothetical protein
MFLNTTKFLLLIFDTVLSFLQLYFSPKSVGSRCLFSPRPTLPAPVLTSSIKHGAGEVAETRITYSAVYLSVFSMFVQVLLECVSCQLVCMKYKVLSKTRTTDGVMSLPCSLQNVLLSHFLRDKAKQKK